MDACHPAVAEQIRAEAERAKDGHALLGDRQVCCPRCADQQSPRPVRLLAPHDGGETAPLWGRRGPAPARRALESGSDLRLVRTCENDRSAAPGGQQLLDDRRALRRRLARAVDGFRQTLAERPVVVHPRKTQVRERQPPQPPHGVIWRARAAAQVVYQSSEFELVHEYHYPAPMAALAQDWHRISFLGPEGTFSEEALLSIPELAGAEPIAMTTIAEALDAANRREVDAAFVPIENSIEGTVSATLDHLVFDVELYIQLECVLDVHLHLLAPAGTELAGIRRVVSIPVALAQCRRFLQDRLRGAELVPATSTAEAARLVGEAGPDGTAAIAPALAGRLYGLEAVAEQVEDHADNQTRFVLVARGVLPPPTGHDRTSLVCFQEADRPGSLHEILGQFAARNINLTKIESRPTKLGLGDYCFVIELEGHLSDEVVGDCLKELHMDLAAVKFLGSYPAFGEHGPERREKIAAARAEADAWLLALRSRIRAEPDESP